MSDILTIKIGTEQLNDVHHSPTEKQWYWVDENGLNKRYDPYRIILTDAQGKMLSAALAWDDGIFLIKSFATSEERFDFMEHAIRMYYPEMAEYIKAKEAAD